MDILASVEWQMIAMFGPFQTWWQEQGAQVAKGGMSH